MYKKATAKKHDGGYIGWFLVRDRQADRQPSTNFAQTSFIAAVVGQGQGQIRTDGNHVLS
jgi:hypothetical protein